MSQAHKGSKLINTGQVKRIGEYTSFLAHYDFTENDVLKGISPLGPPVATLHPQEGKFGGGIAVEEETINIVYDGNMQMYGRGYSPGWDVTLNGDIELYNWFCYGGWLGSASKGYHAHANLDKFGYPVLEFKDMNSSIGEKHRWMGATQFIASNVADKGWVDGVKVTVSMDMMVDNVDKGIDFGLQHTNSEGVDGMFDCESGTLFCSQPYKWERISATFTINVANGNWKPDSSCTLYIYGHFSRNDAEGTAWIKNVQIENKEFATSFTPTSRNLGVLQYPADSINPLYGTINLWYKPSYTSLPISTTTSPKIISVGELNGNFSFFLIQLPTYLRLQVRGSGMTTTTQIRTTSVMTGWTMLTITWNNGIFKIYVNGVIAATSNNTFANIFTGPISGNVISVGGDGLNAHKPCNGIIDELRIDTIDMSDDDILSWYLAGTPFYPRGVYKIAY
ncbi:LamG-like jellyroll fold domain-containing protein [Paenibacillus illinoisensis]|uniref:LamG-like jellyroll fold domain-containing protein n=1 Tax=Paenibacillus illinoisensis TaxID=59845 RepID=UPI00301ADBFA